MATNAIMKHGEAATEILDLNLNHGCCSRGCHVDVTTLQQKRGILRSKYPCKQQRNQIPKTRSSEHEFVANS